MNAQSWGASTGGPANQRLDDYQAALLDILHRGSDGEVMAAEIDAAAQAASLPTGELDAQLIEVAADLTRTWGRVAR